MKKLLLSLMCMCTIGLTSVELQACWGKGESCLFAASGSCCNECKVDGFFSAHCS